MSDPRGFYFVIIQRQRRWSLSPDEERRPFYRSEDALPLAPEPQRERASYPRRLALRLRMLFRSGRQVGGPHTEGA